MIFLAVFLISAVLFALEILQTRMLSFTAWHHMTYMVAAVSLTGYVLAGTVLFVKKSLKDYGKFISRFSLLFVLSIPFAFFMSSRIPLDPLMPNKLFMIIFLFCDYFFLFLPHFIGGLVLFSIFQNYSKNVNISCFFSILGSIAGCFAALPLMEVSGMEGALVIVALSAALSSVMIAFASKKGKACKAFSVILLVFVLLLFPLKNNVFEFRASPSKFLSLIGLNPELTGWDRAGRVDVVSAPADKLAAVRSEWAAFQRGFITKDGDSASLIYDFSGNRHEIALSLCSTGYFGLQNPDVFIGGLSMTDVSAALFWQAKSVTTVEINKSFIDLSVHKFSTFQDNVLKDEKVSIVHGEVREFLENSGKKYDLIQLPETDSFAALLNGAYIMNETYLYTKEAFKTYFDHLNDNGTLAVARRMHWPPRETLKVAVTASAVLKETGIEHPENNIIIVGDGHVAVTMVKKRPFSWTELNEIAGIVAETNDLRIIYAPGFSAGSKYYYPVLRGINLSVDQAIDFIKIGFGYFFSSLENGTEKMFVEDYPYNIEPASDDKPFFFNYFKFGGEELPPEIRNILADESPFMLIIMLLTVVQLLFLSLSMLVTPVFFISKDEKKFLPFLQIAAFAATGFGFMFIVMSFIQKFTLLFGDPSTSALLAVGILLAFSALGALFGKRILIAGGEKLFFSVLAILLPIMILGYAAALPRFMAFCAGHVFSLKLLFAALFILPLGFVMGTVFPVSLLIVGEKKPFFIPLAFSSEVAASILASVLAVMISMAYGFKFVFVMAAFCYFFAVSAMLYFVKRKI